MRLPVTHLDWSTLTPQDRDTRSRTLWQSLPALRLDLTQAPLMRLTIARLPGASVQLFWSSHHLLLDGWSFADVLAQVFGEWAALGGAPTPARKPRRPYRGLRAVAGRPGRHRRPNPLAPHHARLHRRHPTALRPGTPGRPRHPLRTRHPPAAARRPLTPALHVRQERPTDRQHRRPGRMGTAARRPQRRTRLCFGATRLRPTREPRGRRRRSSACSSTPCRYAPPWTATSTW
ncbi:hypothetical protein GXP74_21230 [Streptacidiphilus sp. P02-A3a]|nr:hypothetical protein GXP74_21230 [Streptacidiphilus sp. P02-A3a]